MILSVREYPGKLTTDVRLLAAIGADIFSRGHPAAQMDDQALSFAFQRIFLHGGRDDAGGAALMHQLLHPGSFVPPAAPWPLPPAASWPAPPRCGAIMGAAFTPAAPMAPPPAPPRQPASRAAALPKQPAQVPASSAQWCSGAAASGGGRAAAPERPSRRPAAPPVTPPPALSKPAASAAGASSIQKARCGTHALVH